MHSIFDERRYLIPFRSGLLPQIFCDTLVIGGGVAGLRAAISAAESGDVIVCSKSPLDKTNTAWAQGGIAAVLRDDDAVASHIEDTLTAGAGLCDASAVDLICREGPARVRELIGWGMGFDETTDGALAVGMEGGHSASRIYHAGGDATGAELQRTLFERAIRPSNVRLFESCFAIDLITASPEPGSPCLGAITHHPRYGLQMIWARTTILASGGAGQVYRETSNPQPATADGHAMAARAGATIADMAFVQFHPTTLYLPGAPRSLISEAVRGEGARLLDERQNRFMVGRHDLAELAPRDIVARAIVDRINAQAGGSVYLDCRDVAGFSSRFPSIHAQLARFGLDPAADLIPIHPAAHYTIGGVRTDLDARTDVPNLFAVGEVACTGLHGANRLASNSLLEGLVMGEIAGRHAARRVIDASITPAPIVSDIRPSTHAELDLGDVRSSLRSAMWKNVGIQRDGTRLEDACEMFDFWGRYTLDKIFDTPDGWEVQNMLLTGALIARSALWRAESRGTHWRDHHPERDPAFAVHDLLKRGRSMPETEPVTGRSIAEAEPKAAQPVSEP
ncbi:MAG: L-aspartate oxidase [Planctomycetota bacterium]